MARSEVNWVSTENLFSQSNFDFKSAGEQNYFPHLINLANRQTDGWGEGADKVERERERVGVGAHLNAGSQTESSSPLKLLLRCQQDRSFVCLQPNQESFTSSSPAPPDNLSIIINKLLIRPGSPKPG